MTIPILFYLKEIAIHVFAIFIVSLLTKLIFNNPSLSVRQEVEADIMDEDTDSNNYSQVRYRRFTN